MGKTASGRPAECVFLHSRMTLMRVAPLALLLAGCSSEAERQVRQYEMMKRNGATTAELCVKGREVADAYLAEENESEYQMWDVKSGLDCNRVALDNLNLSR